MFYIIDQGARVRTPLDRLLDNQAVNSVSASNKLRPVSDQGQSATANKAAGQLTQHTTERNAYQQLQHSREPGKAIYAHQIMTSPVITGDVDLPLTAIWQLLSRRGFHHLPLVDDQQHIQGIVSDRDLLRFAANNNRQIGSVAIRQLMTRRVITAARDTEVRTLAEVMCRHAIGAVPIEDDKLNLVGIVSRSDILRTLVNHGPLELWV